MSRELDSKVFGILIRAKQKPGDSPMPQCFLDECAPAYSTDAACIPELFDHLGKTGSVEVTRRMDGIYRARHRSTRQGDSDYMHGSTLSEALAKLVVAVGDAQRSAE